MTIEKLREIIIKRCIKETDTPEEVNTKMELIDKLCLRAQMGQLDSLITQMENY